MSTTQPEVQNQIQIQPQNEHAPDAAALAPARPAERREPRARRRGADPYSGKVKLHNELQALEAIRAGLANAEGVFIEPEDTLLIAESETNLLETLDWLLEADVNDEGLIEGLKRAKDTLSLRLARIDERRTLRRAVIEQALMMLELKRLERPVATLTLANRSPTLLVEHEAEVPARFFELRPVLNKRLLKEALEAGEEIAGASLTSGALTLTVRRR